MTRNELLAALKRARRRIARSHVVGSSMSYCPMCVLWDMGLKPGRDFRAVPTANGNTHVSEKGVGLAMIDNSIAALKSTLGKFHHQEKK